MSPAVLEIDVNVTPGASFSDGLVFSYSSTSPCLDDEKGNITLPRNGRAVMIRFNLLTKTLSWKEGPYVGTFEVNLQAGKDATAEDTLWIWPAGSAKGKAAPSTFSGYEFGDDTAARHRRVSVRTANGRAETHCYGLAVGIVVRRDKIEVVRDDPRIRNGGLSAE